MPLLFRYRLFLTAFAVLFVVLFLAHAPVLALLYDASFAPSPLAVALIFAGSVARIASWIPLFALYAASRTTAIAAGEFLSLPLFAALVFALRHELTLELAGALWLASYLVYAAFNAWALRRA